MKPFKEFYFYQNPQQWAFFSIKKIQEKKILKSYFLLHQNKFLAHVSNENKLAP